jgi:hypothetical protein
MCNLTPSKEVGPWGCLFQEHLAMRALARLELQELIFHFIM